MQKQREKRSITLQNPLAIVYEENTQIKEKALGPMLISRNSAADNNEKEILQPIGDLEDTIEKELEVELESVSSELWTDDEKLFYNPRLSPSAASNMQSPQSRLSDKLERRLLQEVAEKLQQTVSGILDSSDTSQESPTEDTTIAIEQSVLETLEIQEKKISETEVEAPQQDETPPVESKLLPMQILLSKANKEYETLPENEDEDKDDETAPPSLLQQYIRCLSLAQVPDSIFKSETINEDLKMSTDFSQEVESSEIKKEKSDEKKLKYSRIVESFADREDSEQKLEVEEKEASLKEDVVLKTKAYTRLEFNSGPIKCQKFQNVKQYAKSFINEIIEEAIVEEKKHLIERAIRSVEGVTYSSLNLGESLSTSSSDTRICIMQWPTIEQFNESIGVAKIVEFLTYWAFEEKWQYCINVLGGESDSSSDFYQYEVIFSIPCKQYPIPQATASVFFTFELSRVRPKDCLVEVYYCFENQRFVHKPSKITFQEKILFNIVDAKIKFFKTLTF